MFTDGQMSKGVGYLDFSAGVLLGGRLLVPDEFCTPDMKVRWPSLKDPSPFSGDLNTLSNSIIRAIGS